ncbi:MAG: MerR family transcriptional regulator [Nitritalea sp.]
MPYKERDIEKKYFTIGEVAQLMGVSTSAIRYWEGEFSIIKPKKDRKGNRQFTKEDIEKLRFIHHLVKEKGYTIQGAQEVVKQQHNTFYDKAALIERLKAIKHFLHEIRQSLDQRSEG